MFEGWQGFINTANQLWDQMVKWQPTQKTTIDGKEIEIPKYFEIEDDKFGKIVFGEESFQGDMMAAEKQILEGTAAIKTLEANAEPTSEESGRNACKLYRDWETDRKSVV